MADDYCVLTRGPHEWKRDAEGDIQCRRCWLPAQNPAEITTVFVSHKGPRTAPTNPTPVHARDTTTFIDSADARERLYAGLQASVEVERFKHLMSLTDVLSLKKSGECLDWTGPRPGRERVTDIELKDGTVGVTSVGRLTWALSPAHPHASEGHPVVHICGERTNLDGMRLCSINPFHLKLQGRV